MTFMKQSSLYLLGRLAPAAIGLCGVALYTRLLDPATIGKFALLVSTAFFVKAIAYTWLSLAALRIVAGSSEQDMPDSFRTTLMLFVCTSFAVLPIFSVVLHLYRPGLPLSSLLLASAAAITAGYYELNLCLLQGQLSVQLWILLNFARAVGTIAVSTAFILVGWKLNALLAGFVLGNCTTFFFAKLWSPALRGNFDGATSQRFFRFGWPQSTNVALSCAAPVGQRWTLEAGAGVAGVGIFSVAQDFSSLTLSSLIGSVSLAGIPLAFRAKDQGDDAALAAQLKANARLIFAVALPATVGLCALAGPISHIVFGPKFWNGSSTILALVALAAFAVNMRTFYFDQAFELAMQTRDQAIISVVGTAMLICSLCFASSPLRRHWSGCIYGVRCPTLPSLKRMVGGTHLPYADSFWGLA